MAPTARLRHPDAISAVDLFRVRIPLLEPFVAAHGTETDREVVIVRVIGRPTGSVDPSVGDGGTDGWGECVALTHPTYTDEYTDGSWMALRDEIVPAALRGEAVVLDGRRMAWTALDAAAQDHELRLDARVGVSSTPLVSAPAPRRVIAGLVVGRPASIGELLDKVARGVADGFVQVKCKIEPGWDVEPLRAIRDSWPTLALAADANGSYGRSGDRGRLGAGSDPIGALDAIDQFGLAYLEQPLAAGDLSGHAALRRRLHTPIALDESISSDEDLRAAVVAGAIDIVNVKPGRVGGIDECARLRSTIRDEGLRAFVGGMLETGVGRAFARAEAEAPEYDLPTDLGPSGRYFAHDIVDPILMTTAGELVRPGGDGFGAVVQLERLAQVTVDSCRIVAAGGPG